jgi:uncharacterized protein
MTSLRLGWDWIGRPGHEDLFLRLEPERIVAEGDITAAIDAAPFRLRYRLVCTADWVLRSAHISAETNATPHECRLARAPDGLWTVNDTPRPDLAACSAIDIMATPLTNTLAIRGLACSPGAPVRVSVAYVAVPTLAVAPREQEYTLLSPGRFRYRGLSTDFTADLEVDACGLVRRYGNVWRRA